MLTIGTIDFEARRLGATGVPVPGPAFHRGRIPALNKSVRTNFPISTELNTKWVGSDVIINDHSCAGIAHSCTLQLLLSSPRVKVLILYMQSERKALFRNLQINPWSRVGTTFQSPFVLEMAMTQHIVLWKFYIDPFGGLDPALSYLWNLGLFWPKGQYSGTSCAMDGVVLFPSLVLVLETQLLDRHQFVIGRRLSRLC